MTAKDPNTVTTPQQYQAPSADDFLMGGGGAPTAKFPTIGTSVGGRITEKPTVQQQRDIQTGEAKFWGDGNPMMQLVVTVQTNQIDPTITDDDGRRRLFIKGQLKNAVQDAVRAVGGSGLEVGGILTVTYVRDGEVKQRGFNPPKQYDAKYVPAAQAELNAPDPGVPAGVNPVTGEITTAPAPAPAAPGNAALAQAVGNPGTVVGGFTPEQLAAIQADPAKAALFAQLTGQQPAPAAQVGGEPPF